MARCGTKRFKLARCGTKRFKLAPCGTKRFKSPRSGRRELSRFVALRLLCRLSRRCCRLRAPGPAVQPRCPAVLERHCESGIAPKKISQPDPEPMCGLDNTHTADDEITIVAEPPHTESHHASEASPSQPALEPLSVSQPCQMECGTCATASSRQHKRERAILQATSHQTSPLTLHSRFEILPFSFSSNEDWEQTSPRGPPAELR